MTHKKTVNGLTLLLVLSLISSPAHAGWFSSISNYFNQPSKNALVATTAVAGASLLATFVCAWNWWKKSKALAQAHEAEQTNITTFNTKVRELNTQIMTLQDERQKNQQSLQELERVQIRNIVECSRLSATLTTARADSTAKEERIKALQDEQASKIENAQRRYNDYANRIIALETQNEDLKEQLAKLRIYRDEMLKQAAE